MANTGKATVVYKPFGDFEVKEYPLPRPERGTMLLKVELCGICGSDILAYQGKNHEVRFPLTMGHEICGRVTELGEGVTTDFVKRKVEVGDRIVLVPAVHCGSCFFCSIAKTPSRCVNSVQYGFFQNPDAQPHFNGGYSQYLYVHNPKTAYFKINASVEAAVLSEPLAVAAHGVRRAKVSPGQTVVVQGAGPIGLLTTLYCRVTGAKDIIVIGKNAPERLKMAREFGATITMDISDSSEEHRVRVIKEASTGGYGADAVIECAGVPEVIREGFKYIRNSGTYCIVGNGVDRGTIPVNPALDILDKNITIEGIYDHSAEDFIKAVNVIEKGRFPFEKMITHRIPLNGIKEAMDGLMRSKTLNGAHVLKPAVDPWR
jgi:L-iditol 2-dehydrogenase